MPPKNAPDDRRVKLRLTGVEKWYGNFQALKPISLDVYEGEFVTLLGPSGSGKTTLLSLIAGTNFADGGRIEVNGRDATDLPARKREVGVIFQNYALFPHLTVKENIAFPLRMRGVERDEIDARCASVLETTNLTSFANRLPDELSGGQQQRVAFARCVVYEPSIILMDEPLGALDKRLRDSMQEEIRRLHRALGTTIVYITHDQTEALTLSDRICLMRDGRIVQSGAPLELYFRPSSCFSAEFFGQANLFRYRIETLKGRELVVPDLGIRTGAPERAEAEEGWLMMRPQCLRIDSAHDQDEVLTGNVTNLRQFGFHTQFQVETKAGATLVADRLTDAAMTGRWDPGTELRLSWDWADCAFFAESER